MKQLLRSTLFSVLTLISVISFAAPLSGTYTIGSSGNYATFNAAVSALATNGVSGRVIFNVQAGTYTEQITIKGIAGASAANSIVFQAANGVASSVTLQYSATTSSNYKGTGNNWVVNLDSAEYVAFNNLTVQALGSTYATVFLLYNHAGYDTIENCVITSPNVTDSSVDQTLIVCSAWENYIVEYGYNQGAGFDYSSFEYPYNLCGHSFIGNTLNGGSMGIWLYYPPNANGVSNIKSNTFNNQYTHAIYDERVTVNIDSNIITTNAANSNYVGISGYIAYIQSITSNKITNCPGTGIYLYASQPVIDNNFIEIVGSAVNYGIAIAPDYGSSSTPIAFNSVLVLNTNSASAALSVNGYGAAGAVEDNLFINRGGGYAVFVTPTGYLSGMNYNDLYTTGSYLGYYGSTQEPALTSWQTATSMDANSINVDPSFVSNTDLHLTNNNVNFGTPITYTYDYYYTEHITNDIDNQTRNATTPDMGADEYSSIVTPNFSASPTEVCVGGTVTFTDHTGNSPTAWQWTFPGGTPSSSTSQNPTVTYNTAGVYPVTFTVTNSNGTDTITTTNSIKVDANAVAGSINISPNTTNCPGTQVYLTQSGNTGVTQWQDSTTGSTWTNISGGTGSYIYESPTVTTYYQVKVQNGVCPTQYTATATASVASGPSCVTSPISLNLYPMTDPNNFPYATCGGTGGINIQVNGGDGSNTYTVVVNGVIQPNNVSLNDYDFFQRFGFAPGTYHVTVYNTDYPADSQSVNYTVYEDICQNVTTTNSSYDCTADGSISVTPTGGDGYGLYDITLTGTTSTGATVTVPAQTYVSSYDFTGLLAGTYYVLVQDADNPNDGFQTPTYSYQQTPISLTSNNPGTPCPNSQDNPGIYEGNNSGNSNNDPNGAFTACYYGTYVYSTDQYMNGYPTGTYLWTISGGTIVGGGTTEDYDVTVQWGNSVSGTITVSYVDGGNNTVSNPTSQSVSLSQCITPISANVTEADPTNCGGNGNIVVNSISGGESSGYYYMTINGSGYYFYTSQLPYSVSVSPNTNYTVNIYDGDDPNGYNNDAVTNLSYYVGNGPCLNVDISGTTSACSGSSYSYSSGVSGGSGNYSYNWSTSYGYGSISNNGNDPVSITWNSTGTDYVNVTVTDNSNGQSVTQSSYSVSINNCGSTISAYVGSQNNENCPGSDDGNATIYASGGDGSNYYYFYWSGPNSGSTTGYSGTEITGLTNGYYTVYVYDNDNQGDGYSTSFGLSIGDNSPSCGSSGSGISAYPYNTNNENCPGSDDGNTDISVSGGDGSNYYYFYWSGPNSGSTTGGSGTEITGLTNGYYTVYVYDNDNQGDGYSTSFGLNIYDNNGSCGSSGSSISASISSQNNESCPGSDDGNATISASGGDGSNYYYFSWSGPNSGSTSGGSGTEITGLTNGYYTVYVYDNDNQGDGYGTSFGLSIGDNSPSCGSSGSQIQISASPSNASTCSSSDGSISVSASGGDGSNYYYFYLSNGQTQYGNNVTFSGLSNGSYTISVYDNDNTGDGYANSTSTSVGYSSCGSGISAYAYNTNNENCPGSDDGNTDISVSGGDGSNYYYFYWSGPNSGSTTGYSGTEITGLTNGYYTVYVYDNDNQGDGYSTSFGLNIYDNNGSCGSSGSSISAYAYNTNNENCPGSDDGNTDISVSGGDGSNYYYFYWSGPNSGSTTGGSGTEITGLTNGYYTVYVYDNDNQGDGYSTSFGLNIYDNNSSCGGSLTVNISESDDNCSEGVGSVYGSATGGSGYYNFSCSCGQSSSYATSFDFTGLQGSNTYYVTATDYYNGGYSGSNDIYVNNDINGCGSSGSQIQISASPSNASTCSSSDGSIYVSASGGDGSNYYYFYLSNGQTQYGNNVTFSGLSNGSYTISVYDNDNTGDGYANSTSTSVGYYSCGSGISAYVSGTSNTNADCVSTGTISISASNGDGSNNYDYYAYNSNNGQYYSGSGGNNGTLTGLASGNYSITVSDADNNNDGYATTISTSIGSNGACGWCSSSQTATICINGVAGNSASFCYNSSASFSECSGNSWYSYSWSSNGAISFDDPNSSSTSGTFTDVDQLVDVYLTAIDNNGCSSNVTDYTSSTTTSSYTPVITVPTLCTGSTVSFTETSGNFSPNGYTWSGDNAFAGVSSSTNTATITLGSSNYGDISVTATDANGCTATVSDQSVYVGVTPAPSITAPSNICYSSSGPNNYTFSYTETADVTDQSISWSADNSIFTGTSSNTTFTPGLTGDGSTAYIYLTTSSAGCSGSTTYGPITISDCSTVTPLTFSSGPTETDATCGQSNGSISATATGGDGNYNWSINPANGTISGQGTASVTFNNLPYGVTYSVTVQDNSSDVTTASGITVNDNTSGCGNVWTGANSNLWSDPLNWSNGVPPNSCSTNVTIPSGTTNPPTIDVATNIGNLTLNEGGGISTETVDVDAALSVCGNITSGSGLSAMITLAGTGSVTLTGTSAQSIDGDITFETLIVDNTSGGVSLTSGSHVYINTSLVLQSGNVDASLGTLTFTSNALTQSAIIDNFSSAAGQGQGTITGNITAQRYYGNAALFGQHMIGSPVGGVTGASLGSGNGSGAYITPTADCDELHSASGTAYGNVFSYHEAHGASCTMAEWYVEPANAVPTPGKGYSVVLTHPGTDFELTGTANLASSYSISGLTNSNWNNVSLQGRSFISGWSLVSNPYLAPLDATSLAAANAGSFDKGILVWNNTTGKYVDVTTLEPYTIAPFQAFLVHRSVTDLTGATYVIDGSNRVTTTSTFSRQQNPEVLNLTATNTATGLTDETTVGFNSNATTGFDPALDFYKVPGDLSRHTLYTLSNNNLWLLRNYNPSITEASTINVGFEPAVSGNYSFSFDGINSFDPTSYIMLEDKQLNVMYNVRSGAYNFSSNATDNWNRFVLHFTPAAIISATDATCGAPGMINIQQPGSAVWNYTVTDANNTLLSSGSLNENSPVTVNAQAGVYTLTLVDNNGYSVVKNIQVNGSEAITATISASASSVQQNQEVTLSGTSSASNSSYSWNFGDGMTGTGSSVTHSYASEGIYTVTLHVVNVSGCTSDVTQTVTVTSRSTTGIANVNAGQISIWSNTNLLYVDFTNMNEVEATIDVYNVLGQKLYSDKYNTSTLYSKQINDIEVGYIIVRVNNNDEIITKKVFISNDK